MGKQWRIFPRPLLETVLNNHVQRHRVGQPLILHGPRGVGKRTLLVHRLLEDWNKSPHIVGYLDFGNGGAEGQPWASLNAEPANLTSLRTQLERCLESLVEKGVRLGSIGSQQVFATLKKWHGFDAALRHILDKEGKGPTAPKPLLRDKDNKIDSRATTWVLWSRAIFSISKSSIAASSSLLSWGSPEGEATLEEISYFNEAMLSLRLAKEVLSVHEKWRANAVEHLNRTGGFSRSLANSSTDWPALLLELLSESSELGYFQPKLVINNIDVLRKAVLTDNSMVPAAMYHDSLLWRLISIGVNERCLPVILLTSDSYYSYRVYMDFGYPDIFISRETFGWTPQEAKMHMVPDFFSESEWTVIADVLGPNSRHLSELYLLKQSTWYCKIMEDKSKSTFEDVVDAYLAYLQVTVVNPAMESALVILQRFASDTHNGKISKDRLRFGAPWRHPPCVDDNIQRFHWAKLQLMDFIQSLVNTEFGINYLADCSLEIMDDPSAMAMLEVGLLYAQRDPSFIRPVSRCIQRCLVRWLVQERMQMNHRERIQFVWHRVIRGRSYRHLMLEKGYKN